MTKEKEPKRKPYTYSLYQLVVTSFSQDYLFFEESTFGDKLHFFFDNWCIFI